MLVAVAIGRPYPAIHPLARPEPYWNSKTTSTILFPVNEEFLKAEGSNFGSVKPSSILYNGPYLLKSLTSKSVMEFVKNQNYYDKDNVTLDSIKLTYYDGNDQEALIRNFSMAFTAQLVSIRIAQALLQSRRNMRTISHTARKILLLITIISTTTVSLTIILLKQQTLKNLRPTKRS